MHIIMLYNLIYITIGIIISIFLIVQCYVNFLLKYYCLTSNETREIQENNKITENIKKIINDNSEEDSENNELPRYNQLFI
jgi:hypothetical protein